MVNQVVIVETKDDLASTNLALSFQIEKVLVLPVQVLLNEGHDGVSIQEERGKGVEEKVDFSTCSRDVFVPAKR